MDGIIRRVMYISKGNRSFSYDELMTMCAQFAAKNAIGEITGLLMRIGDWFVQVIEGPDNTMSQLLSRIAVDSRHECFTILSDHLDDHRVFGQWSMNLIDLDLKYYVNVKAVAELREQIDDMMLFSPDKKQVMKGVIKNVIERVRSSAPRPIAYC